MKISDVLSRDEIAYFSKKSDLRGLGVVVQTWASILILFYVVVVWTNVFTVLALLVLLPGRMLALSIISHDCGHRVLFESNRLNHIFGQYFASNIVFSDLPSYARSHKKHHKLAGTEQDPDLVNYKNYPVSKASFKRKLVRDITGKTGYKLLRFVVTSAFEYRKKDRRDFAWPFVKELMVQAIFAAFLAVIFSPLIYLLWVGTFLTTYMIVVRLRQLAEHAVVPDLYDLDPRKNTRTVVARWWEKLFVAPNNVNYHLEHHFMASVPCYRLPELHACLKDKGAYDETPICYGYNELFPQLIAQ